MRATTRKEIVVSMAMIATLLLTGFGCQLPAPPPENDDSIIDEANGQNGAMMDDSADDADDANAPYAGARTRQPVWIIGSPDSSFVHVQPGVKSELYVDFQTGPGEIADTGMDPNNPVPTVSIDLDGPGVMGTPVIIQPFEPNSKMHFVFPINRFGDYSASGDVLENGRSVFHFDLDEHVK